MKKLNMSKWILTAVMTLLASSQSFASGRQTNLLNCQPLQPGNGLVEFYVNQFTASSPGAFGAAAFFTNTQFRSTSGVARKNDLGQQLQYVFFLTDKAATKNKKIVFTIDKSLTVPGGTGRITVSGALHLYGSAAPVDSENSDDTVNVQASANCTATEGAFWFHKL